jgi:hypothetical protein
LSFLQMKRKRISSWGLRFLQQKVEQQLHKWTQKLFASWWCTRLMKWWKNWITAISWRVSHGILLWNGQTDQQKFSTLQFFDECQFLPCNVYLFCETVAKHCFVNCW